MYINFGMIINAVLLALGIYWCYEMLGRWRSDLDELRTVDDNMARAVIIGLWAITAVIAFFAINSALGWIASAASAIKGLF